MHDKLRRQLVPHLIPTGKQLGKQTCVQHLATRIKGDATEMLTP
jgi:hypothetical protein